MPGCLEEGGERESVCSIKKEKQEVSGGDIRAVAQQDKERQM